MNRCHRYQDLLEDCLAGEISTADMSDLEDHCSACPACNDLLGMHRNIQALGDEIPLPGKPEFRSMRSAVLAATAGKRRRGGFLADLGQLWSGHPLPAGLATAAMLVGAVVLGRWSPLDQSFEEELLRQPPMGTTAQPASLDSYLDSPFSYANVTVRRQGEDQLALSFDASRHLEMVVDQDSPLAREVLLQAILDPSSMGSRLRAMKVTPSLDDDLLKEALVATMLNDPDPTVRINALAVLTRYPYDQRSQEALILTLGQDQDVQMRLSALKELGKQNVGLETIRQAVGKDDPHGTMDLLHQATLEF